MNFVRQICEDFSVALLPGIHTLIIHRSQDAYNYIWKIFPGSGYGTRNSFGGCASQEAGAVPVADTFSLRVARSGTKLPPSQLQFMASHYCRCSAAR